MKKLGTLALTLVLIATGSVHAAEVLEETKDQTSGKSVGGMSGMMIGAIGGPLGMLVGAGVGALFGGEAQDASGLSERAYKAGTAGGEEKVLRAPNDKLVIGEAVEIRGNRAYREATAQADSGISYH
ncbi:hypothetical protein AvCA_01720 [Azotobacter vinelandii CA]|uniref:Uncharacterized protein n=2 Tax=Azotobacter vinelandii TaxID=354 RepID=C1DH28_AZOVD|nr:hypothetical protein [Azotobacter vinelandii]ACO76435.1 hypothetical protein Avin_01720 [Azotobacter vinelandii DJ]AGK17409.1 hypothetical protein AvCA_01720 [Azotobacter vinelandii CA]AGK19119.1 hypothetical protein AvCA6_01720 [Azotobacter vinelandii CA6]WKN22214.1 hypothetical protein AVAEIV_000164 [Azotobacter vinelandii]SFX77416.1 hypothetical protein SAMN04244547_02722 [Azotobacter vinelandii]